jgi:ABC-type transport system involved in cytochrome c biogenesis permease subunit
LDHPGAGRWTSLGTAIAIVFVCAIYAMSLGAILRPVGIASKFDLDAFGALPISYEGRVQPLDSLARNSLKIVSGRETASVDEGSVSAIRWLADVFGQPEKASNYKVIRIDHKDILGLLNLDANRKRFSIREILASAEKLQEQIDRARAIEKNDARSLDLFQRKILELDEKLRRYIELGRMESLYLIPPLAPGEKWQPLATAMHGGAADAHPAAKAYLAMIGAYHEDQPDTFNRELSAYTQQVREKVPTSKKAEFEAAFNHFDPFTQCIALYLTAFILGCLSWLFWGVPLRRAALFATLFALLIHTGGIICRMYISGRPPVVSNLASTAIFISWGAIVLAMGLEFFYRNGIGTVCAASMGFLSLLIADRLALSGDTLKVMQAVLDTNFWLATHVVVVTLGYSATFLAGILGIIYVIGGVFTKSLDKEASKELTRMIYGIVCFAILFSFVGTILGGIWADQSWGRFWGWDPKENGAVLIVLSNAILLHARWGGLIKERGIACLAIFGNIVTSWSWFGVNMLGVGLHSYGFMDSALKWLLVFVLTQVVLIVAALLPITWWRSYPRLAPAEPRRRGERPAPAALATPA